MARKDLSSCNNKLEKMQEVMKKLEKERNERVQYITLKIFGNIIDNKENGRLVLLLEKYGNDKKFCKYIENAILEDLEKLKEKIDNKEISFKDNSQKRKKKEDNIELENN